MKISFTKYPVDIIICMLWSLILLPIALIRLEGAIRIILGLPFLLFIPGYVLIFALFPTIKTDKGIDIIERIALSFGLSIAIVPLIGLGLNYTPWGIRLEPIIFSLFIFITGVGSVAIYRWIVTNPDERFIISFDIPLPKYESKIDKALTIFLIASIIIATASFIYVAITPKTGEKFTEFYLLGSEGIAEEYPRYIHIGENAEVIIGIVNHEYRIVNYTVGIWLVNQTITYNETEQKNYTIIHNMWFVDKITTTIEHSSGDLGQSWTPQWEYTYPFSINRKGFFKLAFLLFKTPAEKYTLDKDYSYEAEQIINSAFQTTHLWINVSDLPKISNVLATPPLTPPSGFVNISCMVFDVDGVDEVFLNISYPDGIVQNFSITSNKTGLIYYCNQTYMVAGDYSYFIWANDTTGKSSISSVSQFSVTDVPKIPDVWASPPSTSQGRFVNISCLVFDADGVDEVFLNISYPDNIVQNFSITSNKTGLIYYCNQTYMAVGDYSYFIWANDIYNNTNTSDVKQFSVTDLPAIYDVLATPPLTPQGRFMNISCTVFDVDGVDSVYLNISYPDGIVQNFSITGNKTGNTYYCNKTYNLSGRYNYFIWANDTTSKSSRSTVSQFSVTDLPAIYDVLATPPLTPQGRFMNISCTVFDVDGVDEVFLNIRDPDGIVQNFSITGNKTGNTYYCNKTYNLSGRYNYFIWANDTTGKSSRSTVSQFSVTDVPVIYDVLATPPSTLQEGFVNISCKVFDADGVDEVFLNISYPDGIVQNFSITGNKTGLIYYCNQTYMVAGDYSYFIWANDIYNNTNMSDVKKFSVTIA